MQLTTSMLSGITESGHLRDGNVVHWQLSPLVTANLGGIQIKDLETYSINLVNYMLSQLVTWNIGL